MTPEAVAEALIIRFEGFSAEPYLCPAGVPTIGYGFTRYPDGRRVQLTDAPMTVEHARQMLRWFILNQYMPAVRRLCPGLEGARLGAITDFCFNLGESNLRASTLRKRINGAQWSFVPAELSKWVLAGGRRLPGLIARRAAEAAYI